MNEVTLKLFVDVVAFKSISKVSQFNNLSQQSVRYTMKVLQNKVQVPLFFREKNELKLTEEGKIFYEFCVSYLKEYENVKKKIHGENLWRDREKYKIEINVASLNGVGETILPEWINRIAKYHSEIKLNLDIASGKTIIENVSNGCFHIGFIRQFRKGNFTYPSIPKDLLFKEIKSGKPRFWVSKNNSLAQYRKISIERLNGETFVQNQYNDMELMEYILREYFHLNVIIHKAVNKPILKEIVYNDLGIYPGLKTLYHDNENIFSEEDPVSFVEVNSKDSYEIVTGFIVRKENIEILQDLLILL